MLHRFVMFLRYGLPALFEVVTPKGRHAKLRFYHRKPIFILWDEATILPNTHKVGGPVVLDIVQMVDPKAKAKRSAPKVHNHLIDDLAKGQAMLTITEDNLDNLTVLVPLPKGLKSRTKGAYGCNFAIEEGDWEPCDRAPKVARIFTAIDDAYFVGCSNKSHSS